MYVNRSVILDHLHKRYFDLGYDFPVTLSIHSFYSKSNLSDTILEAQHRNMPLVKCLELIEKIHAFIEHTSPSALEIAEEGTSRFNAAICDLRYSIDGSRYDISPRSLRPEGLPDREIDIPPASHNEVRMCYESGARSWSARTRVYSIAYAYEAIRRGKANLPS